VEVLEEVEVLEDAELEEVVEEVSVDVVLKTSAHLNL
jgi:hypothetical protein